MEAVLYSTFRNHLKDYMKKVNDKFEPLTVVNKNPDEDIVVLSKSEWDSIQETLRIAQIRSYQTRFCEEWIKFVQDTSLIYREYLSEILLLLETNFLHSNDY